MGRSILSIGVVATHPRITKLANFKDVICLSDYDALVFDPLVLHNTQVSPGAFLRRQSEVRDLVLRKGGLVLWVLRPPAAMHLMNQGRFDVLNVFDTTDGRAFGAVKETLRLGTTAKWGIVAKGAMGPTCGFVRALAGRLRAEAFLEMDEPRLRTYSGELVAANSAGWPVSVEFVSGGGRICFVPVPVEVPDGQLGSVIARMVEEHFGGSVEIELPGWVDAVSVPGADANNVRIVELERNSNEIAAELSRLSQERARLLKFRVLLFGTGKSVLEPVVRLALRELGFKVLDPEEYEGEWDVDLTDDATGGSAVGEVEGSEGAINVDKLRQLLEYVEAEENQGRRRKGILVGNGYRLKALGEPERREQFTEMALKRAGGFEYCLLPTSELFAAVCAVLKSPNAEALKKFVRNSILCTVGVWKFVEPTTVDEGAAADVG